MMEHQTVCGMHTVGEYIPRAPFTAGRYGGAPRENPPELGADALGVTARVLLFEAAGLLADTSFDFASYLNDYLQLVVIRTTPSGLSSGIPCAEFHQMPAACRSSPSSENYFTAWTALATLAASALDSSQKYPATPFFWTVPKNSPMLTPAPRAAPVTSAAKPCLSRDSTRTA